MNLRLTATAWNIPRVRYAAMALLGLAVLGGLGLDGRGFQHSLDIDLQRAPAITTPLAAQELPLNIADIAAFLGLQPQVTGSASQPNTPLTLLASFVESRHDLSRALIQSPEKTAFYHIGESLPGGGSLASVDTHEVVVLRNGQRQTLTFAAPTDPLLIALPPTPTPPINPASTTDNPT